MVDIIYIFRLYYAHAQTARKHARCSYCACRAYPLWHSSVLTGINKYQVKSNKNILCRNFTRDFF